MNDVGGSSVRLGPRSKSRQMGKAHTLVLDMGRTQIESARELGVSQSKVSRLIRSYDHGRDQSKGGRPQLLTFTEEAELVRWIIDNEKINQKDFGAIINNVSPY